MGRHIRMFEIDKRCRALVRMRVVVGITTWKHHLGVSNKLEISLILQSAKSTSMIKKMHTYGEMPKDVCCRII